MPKNKIFGHRLAYRRGSSPFHSAYQRFLLVLPLLLLLNLGAESISAQSSGSAVGEPMATKDLRGIGGRRGGPVLDRTASTDMRNVKDKPTVYISFERTGKREPLLNGEGDEGIWLRLHNNTRWSIKLDMNDVPSEEYGDADLFYEVVADEKVVVDMRCHVCSSDRVPPGESLLFSVPQEHLAKGRAIRIRFTYEWEEDENRSTSGEPQHHVSFYSSKLPSGFLGRRSKN